MSVFASPEALANVFSRPEKSAADMNVPHSKSSVVAQRKRIVSNVRSTKLVRNLTVNQSDLTFRVTHD